MSSSSSDSDDDLFAGGPVFGSSRRRTPKSTSLQMSMAFDDLLNEETDKLSKKRSIQAVMVSDEQEDTVEAEKRTEKIEAYEKNLLSMGDQALQDEYNEIRDDAVFALVDGRATNLGTRSLFTSTADTTITQAKLSKLLKEAGEGLPDSFDALSKATLKNLHTTLLPLLNQHTSTALQAIPTLTFKPLLAALQVLISTNSLNIAARFATTKFYLFILEHTSLSETWTLDDIGDMLADVVTEREDPSDSIDAKPQDAAEELSINPSNLNIASLAATLEIIAAIFARPALVRKPDEGVGAFLLSALKLSLDPALHTIAPLARGIQDVLGDFLTYCDALAIPLTSPIAFFPLIAGNFEGCGDEDDLKGSLALYVAVRNVPIYSTKLDKPTLLPGAAQLRMDMGVEVLELLLGEHMPACEAGGGLCSRGYNVAVAALDRILINHKTASDLQRTPPTMLAVLLLATLLVSTGMTEFFAEGTRQGGARKVSRYEPFGNSATVEKVGHLAGDLEKKYKDIKHMITAAFAKDHLRRSKEECSLGEVRERNVVATAKEMLGVGELKQQTLTGFTGSSGTSG